MDSQRKEFVGLATKRSPRTNTTIEQPKLGQLRVAVTAHRNTTEDDFRVIWDAMSELVKDDAVKEVYFGGARGGDSIALEALLTMRKGPYPQAIVIVPDTVHQQPGDAQDWISQADQVIELKMPITKADGYWSYKNRNERLIDCAKTGRGYLIAFWNGRPSGTSHAVEVAMLQQVPIIHIPISGG
jgi:hypothetical protein